MSLHVYTCNVSLANAKFLNEYRQVECRIVGIASLKDYQPGQHGKEATAGLLLLGWGPRQTRLLPSPKQMTELTVTLPEQTP